LSKLSRLHTYRRRPPLDQSVCQQGLEKPNKPGSVRPIVIPRATDRVVQRCILDALISDPTIKTAAFQPASFGGIPKREGDEFGGVPAAVRAVLKAIEGGGSHVIVADISSFFSNIRKSDAVRRVTAHSSDAKFIKLFEEAIDVDLANHEELWRHKDAFPYGDVGVGQGVCLSPFLGNLVLSDFDMQLNVGDCSCIRYVDDIIIIAPSARAANARFRQAKRILNELGMSFASDKTSPAPIEISQNFEYLGIDFCNGLLRPSQKSRSSIVRRATEVAAKSLQSIRSAQSLIDFKAEYSIPKTLYKISGMSRGWANHYRFCNDLETIRNVDRRISSVYLDYSSKATEMAQEKLTAGKADLAASFLGYTGLTSVQFSPFEWPRSLD
ncbi:reverse transcriptase domain-containing protein, partial [Qipengyuania huizhouensis]|uniref:reverse transcriptase domain-containing protein n=1 Tax=Qipengyuania huizhouensis TaxID=2867245 RepID=UPI001C88B81B